MIGRTLAHYQIVGRIGAGGMGEVYRAHDLKLRRDVAIKVLPADVASDPVRRGRFEREALAVAALHHPNVVTIHAVEQVEDVHFLVMELVEGTTLSRAIPPDGMAVERLLPIALELADALAAAHARGITHRDLKPANVMLDAAGRVKVLDFGLARFADGGDSDPETRLGTQAVTRDGQILGTVLYMSPEQARGETVGPPSDVFSAGVLFYEALTGELPFRGASPAETIGKLLHTEPAPLPAAVPPALAALVMDCLAKDPAKRPADGAALLQALRAAGPGAAAGSAAATPAATTSATVAAGAAASDTPAASASSRDRALARVHSVAVMPFATRGGDEEAEFLSDGLTENLIGALARFPELRVLSSSATFILRDAEPDAVALGERLGADAIVFGRLARRPDRVVVSAELVSASDRSRLWGARFDKPAAEIATLELEVADNIARQLLHELSTDDEAAPARAVVDPNAYLLYLKAKPLLVGTAIQMQKATEYLQQAIELAPGYAVAHAALALAYAYHSMHSVRDMADARRLSRAAAERALELDPDLPEAHTALGIIRFHFDWDWEGADREHCHAIELGPGRDLPHLEYSEFLTGVGRLEEALEEARKARELDPVSPNAPHAIAYALLLMGDYDGAIREFRAAIDQHPNWTWGQIKIARTYAEVGRFDEALEAAANAEAMLHGGGTPLARSWLGYAYARAGQEERAREALRAIEETTDRYVDPVCPAFVHLGLGDRERALDLLERAYRERSPLSAHMAAVGALGRSQDLGSEPRFRSILERMAYPAREG